MFAITFSAGSAATELRLPLSSKTLAKYLVANPAASIESLLLDLPNSYRDHFVLMHHSRSLHRSTYEEPRQIFFGPDARFLLGVGGVPGDPRFQIVEFAEFEESEGRYYFGTIDFRIPGKPIVTPKIVSCQGCHASPTRPIWGQYPRWAGAYSDHEGKVGEEDRAGFGRFLAGRLANPRYAHLNFSASADGSYFGLTSRKYPFANTDMNHEVGNTVALGTLTRMKQHPKFQQWQFAILGSSDALECIRTDAWFPLTQKINRAYEEGPAAQYPKTTSFFVKALRLVGVDAGTELSLESPLFELKKPETYRTNGKWQTGAYRLDEAIAFHLMNHLLHRDPVFEKFVHSERTLIDRMVSLADLVGEGRAQALQKSYAWFLFFDVFDPLVRNKNHHGAMCDYLARSE